MLSCIGSLLMCLSMISYLGGLLRMIQATAVREGTRLGARLHALPRDSWIGRTGTERERGETKRRERRYEKMEGWRGVEGRRSEQGWLMSAYVNVRACVHTYLCLVSASSFVEYVSMYACVLSSGNTQKETWKQTVPTTFEGYDLIGIVLNSREEHQHFASILKCSDVAALRSDDKAFKTGQ